MKVLVGTFNQEKALGGAFSAIVKTDCEINRWIVLQHYARQSGMGRTLFMLM